MPARLTRPGPPRRGTTRTSLGRSGRPLHFGGKAHHAPAASQTRRPASDRDHPRRRLPDRATMTGPQPLPGRSLQARLTLFYATAIFVAGIVVLAVVTVPLAGIQSAHPRPRQANPRRNPPPAPPPRRPRRRAD